MTNRLYGSSVTAAAMALALGCSSSKSSTPPVIESATALSSSKINVVWHDNTVGETGVVLERAESGGDFQVAQQIATSSTTGAPDTEAGFESSGIESYIDSGLKPATRYRYRLRVYFEANGGTTYSGYSNIVEAVSLGPDSVIDQSSAIPGYDDHVSVDVAQQFPDISTIASAPKRTVSLYGLYMWYNFLKTDPRYSFLEEIKAVGWKSLRVGAGMTDFDDQAMEVIAGNDLEAMLTIYGGADLDRSARNADGNYRYGLPLTGAGCDAGDQQFIADYLTLIGQVLSRYGPGGSFFTDRPALPDKPIRHVEIWNEPNEHYLYYHYLTSSPPSPISEDDKAALYAKLIKASYDHIKTNWPSVNVVGLSASGSSRNDLAWAKVDPDEGFIQLVHENVAALGGNPANFYDILSDHPYTHMVPPDAEDYPMDKAHYHYSVANSFAQYRQIMSNFGNGAKPVWFTEVGWPRTSGLYPANDNSVPERFQAAYTLRLYMTALRLGVETVHVMFMFDADGKNYGFFRYADRGWYESAYAVQNMIRLLPNPRIVTPIISDGGAGYYAYLVKPDDDQATYAPVLVAWNVAGPKEVALPCDATSCTLTDMFGNTKLLTPAGGLVPVTVGPFPVYLKGN